MHIGIKLNVGFAEREPYQQLYGRRDVLAYLHDLGVRAAEAPVGSQTDPEAIRVHASQCAAAGVRLSMHPYTEGTDANPARFAEEPDNACRALHEGFFRLAAEAAELQRGELVVNIHSAAGPLDVSRAALVDQSVRFFAWARQWCERHAPLVRPVAELQIRPKPDEPIQRIGDNFDELLEVVERSGCGACWDLGHAHMNAARFGLPAEPSAELLRRVAHVHCHDVDDEDHQPLLFDRVPWGRHLTDLAAAGFDGTVILEVPPEHFLPHGGLAALEESVRVLREFVRDLSRV
jgi:sugar phosphate isomerase/epimerase